MRLETAILLASDARHKEKKAEYPHVLGAASALVRDV